VLAFAALPIDSRDEVADRNALSSSDAFELISEGVLQGHAGFMPAEIDASLENLRNPAWAFGSLRHQGCILLR
jgi:hypothetical protein